MLDHIDEISRIILKGLREWGREKTFAEILAEAGVLLSDEQRLEIAAKLEAEKLIHSVSYQLPVAIRAELTDIGKEYVDSLNSLLRNPHTEQGAQVYPS